jgi:hypothetical protein
MRKPDPKSLGALPSAIGQIARLAYTQAKKAGIDLGPLLKEADITLSDRKPRRAPQGGRSNPFFESSRGRFA